MDILIPVLAITFFGFFAYSAFSKRGKSLYFEGKIVRSIEKGIKRRRGILNAGIKVHVLETNNPALKNMVGLEITQSSGFSYSMTPISISKDEANQLIEMLQQAVNYSGT